MTLSPEQRSSRARIGAFASWAKTDDRSARTKKARDGMLARFEREVDPDGELAPEVRRQRAELARKAFMLSLAAKSAKARAARKSA